MGYKSAAQRKAVHASKADGGKGNPNRKKKTRKKRKTKKKQIMLGSKRQNKMFKKSKRGYVQKKHPHPVTSCGRRRSFIHKS